MLTQKSTQDLVNVALQTKAPALYRELQQHGTLDQFIDELAHEMTEFVAAQLDRVQARAAQSPSLDTLQSAQDLAAEQRGAEGQAIATYLEFPPETIPREEHIQAWCE